MPFSLPVPSIQILQYGFVGGMSALTHLSLGWLLAAPFALDPRLANGLAFAASFIVSYAGNSLWTFSGHGQSAQGPLLRYVTTVTIGLIYNILFIQVFVIWLGLDYLVMLTTIIVTWPLFSFMLLKFWVFAER